MTLNVNEPADTRLVSELPSYIRENRVAINAFESGDAEYTTTTITLATGTTTLVVGTDLANVDMEIILISALGACVLENITGGSAGQIKIFVMQDNDISFKDGVKSEGKFYLNQLPALTDFDAAQDDVLAVVNVGGSSGYWKEFNRQISVK